MALTAFLEDLIRREAAARGIDPDTAIKVVNSEGGKSYIGDNGSSFGPFQLHYGGIAPGGNSVSGKGDDFTAKTGLDARDPATTPQQITFALDEAARNGWGAWHGAKAVGIGNWDGIGGTPTGTPGVAAQQAQDLIAKTVAPTAPGTGSATSGALGGGIAPTATGTAAQNPYLSAALQAANAPSPQTRHGMLNQLLFGQGGWQQGFNKALPNGLLGGLMAQNNTPMPQSAPPGLQQQVPMPPAAPPGLQQAPMPQVPPPGLQQQIPVPPPRPGMMPGQPGSVPAPMLTAQNNMPPPGAMMPPPQGGAPPGMMQNMPPPPPPGGMPPGGMPGQGMPPPGAMAQNMPPAPARPTPLGAMGAPLGEAAGGQLPLASLMGGGGGGLDILRSLFGIG